MAIPKIIHYCWLSEEPYPELVQKCMRSWREFLPDYDFILWNRERAATLNSQWVDSAMAAKKWAFAADYIRLYALYNHGGIYLDCDVEVLKNFEELLTQDYLLGREFHKNVIEAAVMGCCAGTDWIANAMKWYENQLFDVREINNPNYAIPVILKKVLEDFTSIEILPAEYLSPKDNRTGMLNVTPNSYCIHHFDGAWFSSYQKEYFRLRVKYSLKFGAIIGLFIATLYSVKMKFFGNG